MERHLDLFRLKLLAVQENGRPLTGLDQNPEVEGFTNDQVGYHLRLLVDDGYLKAVDVTPTDATFPKYIGIKLTNKGHDFIDATGNEKVYAATKSILATVGSWTMEIAKQVAQKQLKQMLGLPTG
jgi:hypothetical protein